MCRIRIILVWLMLFVSYFSLYAESNDSIVSVTTSDLKYANLIFVEHNKLLKENILFRNQIENYIELNNQLTQVDSLRLEQIHEHEKLNQSYIAQVDALNKEIKKKNRTIKCWQIGGITVSIGLVLFLLLK